MENERKPDSVFYLNGDIRVGCVCKGIVTAEKTYPQAYVFFGDTHMPEAHALHTEKIHKTYHVRAADLQAQESEEAVSGFLARAGYTNLEIFPDLAGISRVVSGRRPAGERR